MQVTTRSKGSNNYKAKASKWGLNLFESVPA